jgi:hypothetical protein
MGDVVELIGDVVLETQDMWLEDNGRFGKFLEFGISDRVLMYGKNRGILIPGECIRVGIRG